MRKTPQTFEEIEIRAILKLLQFMNFEFNIETIRDALEFDQISFEELRRILTEVMIIIWPKEFMINAKAKKN